MKILEARTYSDIVTINVDVQNDFALPTGLLSVTDGEAVVAPLNELNAWTRQQQGDVVFTQDWHPEATAHFEVNGGVWPIHCVQDTPGAALHGQLHVDAQDVLVHKGLSLVDDGYSGFEGVITNGEYADTGLAEFITAREKQAAERRTRLAIVVGGLATDFCDKATALDALTLTDRRTTDVFVVTDGMRAVNLQPHDGDAALQAMVDAGAIALTTQDIINGGIVIDQTRLER